MITRAIDHFGHSRSHLTHTHTDRSVDEIFTVFVLFIVADLHGNLAAGVAFVGAELHCNWLPFKMEAVE